MLAVESGNVEAVRTLINLGADINYFIRRDDTYSKVHKNTLVSPLSIALRNNNGDMVRLLLEMGATINSENTEENSLYLAVQESNIIATKALLENSTEPQKLADLNITIELAIMKKNREIILLLLQTGIDIDKNLGFWTIRLMLEMKGMDDIIEKYEASKSQSTTSPKPLKFSQSSENLSNHEKKHKDAPITDISNKTESPSNSDATNTKPTK